MKRFLKLLLFIGICVAIYYAISYTYAYARPLFKSVTSRFNSSVTNFDKQIFNTKRSGSLAWFNPYRSDKNKLLNPDTLLLGVHDSRHSNLEYAVTQVEDSLHVHLPLIHFYISWGNSEKEAFPQDVLSLIIQMGAVPVITWEPWLQGFSNDFADSLREPGVRNKKGMRDVASGLYDEYIIEWANGLAKLETPVFMRFAHEMNDPYRFAWGPHNNDGADYVAAWQHIYNTFKEYGATNCIWVWNPHLSYSLFDECYPGNEYVDYIGINALNFGSSVEWSQWTSFEDIFGKHYDALCGYKKPIMIAEFASLAYGGDRVQWYAEALTRFPQRFPQVKALMLFHVLSDYTVSNKQLEWSLVYDHETLVTVRDSIAGW